MTTDAQATQDPAAAAAFYAAIGAIFLIGLALDALGHRTHVPRVTLLMVFGLLLGPGVLNLLPSQFVDAGHLFSPLALTMIAFLLGGSLERKTLRAHGREILVMSLTVIGFSVLFVGGGLWFAGMPLASALLLGAISSATAPAATMDVIRQSGITGRFVTNLKGIVAIDDAWGLIVFSLALTLAGVWNGDGAGALWLGLREILGSLLLGAAVGFPGAVLTGRIKPGEPTLIEALGLVFLVAGLSLWLELSFLLAGMTAGAIIVNLAQHHDRPFHEIERIEWPFLLLFFVLAGASLELGQLSTIGLLGAVYVVLRVAARIIGGLLGGPLAGVTLREGWLTGLALMPQAGVAIGMALVAAERFPELGQEILTITIATTVAFELLGPMLTQYALAQAAEDNKSA